MSDLGSNLLPIMAVAAAAGLIPFAVITTTAFLKISIVLFLVRNALDTQQTPPTLVLYAVALVLTAYVSAPVVTEVVGRLQAPGVSYATPDGLRDVMASAAEPVKASLRRSAPDAEREFLLATAQRIWPDEYKTASTDDLLILIPAFVISELTRGFEAGFLLYLPFIAIDLIVSSILMAMGMMMVSPQVISTPFKIFLLVVISGWTRLLHGLLASYAGP